MSVKPKFTNALLGSIAFAEDDKQCILDVVLENCDLTQTLKVASSEFATAATLLYLSKDKRAVVRAAVAANAACPAEVRDVLASDKRITVADAASYAKRSADRGEVVTASQRRAAIKVALSSQINARQLEGLLAECHFCDNEMLNLIAGQKKLTEVSYYILTRFLRNQDDVLAATTILARGLNLDQIVEIAGSRYADEARSNLIGFTDRLSREDLLSMSLMPDKKAHLLVAVHPESPVEALRNVLAVTRKFASSACDAAVLHKNCDLELALKFAEMTYDLDIIRELHGIWGAKFVNLGIEAGSESLIAFAVTEEVPGVNFSTEELYSLGVVHHSGWLKKILIAQEEITARHLRSLMYDLDKEISSEALAHPNADLVDVVEFAGSNLVHGEVLSRLSEEQLIKVGVASFVEVLYVNKSGVSGDYRKDLIAEKIGRVFIAGLRKYGLLDKVGVELVAHLGSDFAGSMQDLLITASSLKDK